MKKITTMGLVFFGVVFLAGCGQKPASQAQPIKSTPVPVKPINNEVSKNQILNDEKSEGIKFSTPINGAVVQTGSKVNVSVELKEGLVLKDLMIMAPGNDNDTVEFSNPPYTTTFTIPADAYGDFAITALGEGTDGNLYSTTVKLSVDSKATLQKINVSPSSLYINLGEQMAISVIGTYSDGTTRDLSASSQGTTYTSSDEKILSVSKDGMVTPKIIGTGFVGVVPKTGEQIIVRVEIDESLE